MDEALRAYLHAIYHDPRNPAAFSSPKTLYNYVKEEGKEDVSLKEITNFLKSEIYTTHHPTRRPKHHSPVISPHILYQLDADTAVLPSKSKRGGKYFVLMIDTFSRRVDAEAVPNLKAESGARALDALIGRMGSPTKLRTDKGSEFRNRLVAGMLKNKGIHHFFAHPPNKANYAERAIRTIKQSLYKAMQSSGRANWDRDMLAETVRRYNARTHRSIGMRPADVSQDNELEVWRFLERARIKAAPDPGDYKFDLNAPVRVSYERVAFTKDYFQKFSTEVFFVSFRLQSYFTRRYKLKDANNVSLEGSFSEPDLLGVIISEQTEYRIERVVGRRIIGGEAHVLVKWLGYSDEFNSYIPASEVKNLNRKR